MAQSPFAGQKLHLRQRGVAEHGLLRRGSPLHILRLLTDADHQQIALLPGEHAKGISLHQLGPFLLSLGDGLRQRVRVIRHSVGEIVRGEVSQPEAKPAPALVLQRRAVAFRSLAEFVQYGGLLLGFPFVFVHAQSDVDRGEADAAGAGFGEPGIIERAELPEGFDSLFFLVRQLGGIDLLRVGHIEADVHERRAEQAQTHQAEAGLQVAARGDGTGAAGL